MGSKTLARRLVDKLWAGIIWLRFLVKLREFGTYAVRVASEEKCGPMRVLSETLTFC